MDILYEPASNGIISIQHSLNDFSRPVFCHPTKQILLIAFTPLQLLVHCPSLAAPQLFHHRPCHPITILRGIQAAPGTCTVAPPGLSVLIYCWNRQISMFNMLLWYKCGSIHISNSIKMRISLVHLLTCILWRPATDDHPSGASQLKRRAEAAYIAQTALA